MENESARGYAPIGTKGGLYIYKFNFVKWDQIQSAKKLSFFGLPYLILRLSVRRPPFWIKTWWVPMCLGDLSSSVIKYCPNGNPLRGQFEGEGTRVSFIEGVWLYLQATLIIGIMLYLISII
ncbi:hypothetical protein [Bdellovibrio svalbardensis]|uniref:Uncharacterized protein n=1 Tax=Bdellovibrio svalbardensis TaxID=2972972 RepID=A0ABT6DHY5_9BACT|nr:hypothetical protein [Bdellovibrio svalbardensis]MDG0816464.1 hypothetical protein [Bdellovibrio svalbardensis]